MRGLMYPLAKPSDETLLAHTEAWKTNIITKSWPMRKERNA